MIATKICGKSKIMATWMCKIPSFKSLPIRSFSSSSSFYKEKPQRMQQVEVDEAIVKQQLGDIQMAFVKKAEIRNKERATRHRFYRKKDWVIGATCITIAISIYAYTIFAMKQETFLDDFEMPDPVLEFEEEKD